MRMNVRERKRKREREKNEKKRMREKETKKEKRNEKREQKMVLNKRKMSEYVVEFATSHHTPRRERDLQMTGEEICCSQSPPG